MSRDTQFAGFAAHLLQELLDQGAYVAISEWATGGDSFKSEQLIAQRVYDLVASACIDINNAQMRSGGICLHPNAMLRELEDIMTTQAKE